MILLSHLALSDLALVVAIYSVGIVSGFAAARALLVRSK